MTAIHRYCRADKRLLDRGVKVIHQGRKPSEDTAYCARREVARRLWLDLPPVVKAQVLQPEGCSL